MAQVMKYFNYPQGEIAPISYNWKGQNMECSFPDGFDWDNMTDTYNNNSTDAQKKAVAELMQACGYAANMNYGITASGSGHMNIYHALMNKFGYSNYIMNLGTEYFTPEEWERILHINLSTCGPVIYSANGNYIEGHCFVIDGYDKDGYFHVNWGWNGTYNGYYLLNLMDPKSSFGEEDYSCTPLALFGINPEKVEFNFGGMFNLDTFYKSSTMPSFKVDNVKRRLMAERSFGASLKLECKDSEKPIRIISPGKVELYKGHPYDLSNVDYGKYNMTLLYEHNHSMEYRLPANYSAEWLLTIGDEITLEWLPFKDAKIEELILPEEIGASYILPVKITVTNPNTTCYSQMVRFVLYDDSDNIIAESFRKQMWIAPNETETFTFKTRLTPKDRVPLVGEYRIALVLHNDYREPLTEKLPIRINRSTGISEIGEDNGANTTEQSAPQYYNLQGLPIENPETVESGIYLIKTESGFKKVIR